MLSKQGDTHAKKTINIRLLLGTTALAMGLSTAGSSLAADVALLLPENVNPRWESQDVTFFLESMKNAARDATVEVFNANNDTAAQQRQAEQALTQGAKVLVVIPIDGESSAIIADSAKEAGVPTIAYDRMINSENTTFWVQADLEGMGYENWTQGWDPAIARRSMDQALTKLDNNVQGVVFSNDGNAGAAIASMEEQVMAGTVPVSGLDCTIQALQLMLLGKQTQCG